MTTQGPTSVAKSMELIFHELQLFTLQNSPQLVKIHAQIKRLKSHEKEKEVSELVR